jgi:hypothetical protein
MFSTARRLESPQSVDWGVEHRCPSPLPARLVACARKVSVYGDLQHASSRESFSASAGNYHQPCIPKVRRYGDRER